MGTEPDTITLSLLIGALGFAAGAALICFIPKQQSAIKNAVTAIAGLILVLDIAGVRLIDFGSAFDPNNPQRVVSLTSMLGPRFGFLGFLGGVIYFGISQRVQTALTLIVGGLFVVVAIAG